jgi:CoA:oxalate CoA-transferase
VEIEALSGENWIAFWKELGLERPDVIGRAWLPFVYRYLAGRCGLPPELHEATRRYTTDQLRRVALESGVALCRVRSHLEVDAKAAAPWTIRPNPINSPTKKCGPTADIDAPLRGLRVVDAGTRLQGPLAARLLGQLGADVIKVEPPGGDFGRASPPLAGGMGAAYLAYNHGKSVVEIDYKRPSGRSELIDLITESDVFLHNWRPGRAEALGLDFDQLGRANPGLVFAWSSGWGDVAEAPSQIAGDYLVQAFAGCGDLLQPPGEPPVPSRVTLVDTTGGLLACEGILAGLYRREKTGRGCRVHTSLLAAAGELIAYSRVQWTAQRQRPVGRLADMTTDQRFVDLLEPIADACWLPAAPWRFA